MYHDYSDIRKRVAEEPLWYDENGVPRYDDFDPGLCPDVYTDQVVLLQVQCAACRRKFDVERSYQRYVWNGKNLVSGLVTPKEAHYGDPPWHDCVGDTTTCDPPWHGCVGDTMICDPQAVLQSWRRDYHGEWIRHPEEEGLI